MAKKRTMPHGRAMPKAKKARSNAVITAETEAAAIPGEKETAPVSPLLHVTMSPRSALRAATAGRGARAGTGLVTDYHYVVSDLKRIGVLAGGMLLILLVLTFVIR